MSPTKQQPRPDRPYAPGYGIEPADGGAGLMDWSWICETMTKCRIFWLSTIFEGRQRPHVMPVWGVWLDDAFFFSTGRKSRKGQNLSSNPACTVTNDNGEEAVVLEGSAYAVEDRALAARVAECQ